MGYSAPSPYGLVGAALLRAARPPSVLLVLVVAIGALSYARDVVTVTP